MSDKPAASNFAGFYAWRLPELTKIARDHGYALATHGTFNRDLDLVAIPWTDVAAEPKALVDEIVRYYDGYTSAEPTHKPHGRLAWSIHFGGGPYIDLSIMPRLST